MFEEGERERIKFPFSEMTRKVFKSFEARSDEPGEFLSGEEKDKLLEQTRTSPEAMERWEKNRNSKYRINSLYAPLAATENFLDSPEADSVPQNTKEDLIKRVSNAYAEMDRLKGSAITKECVEEVVDIVNEVKKYLK